MQPSAYSPLNVSSYRSYVLSRRFIVLALATIIAIAGVDILLHYSDSLSSFFSIPESLTIWPSDVSDSASRPDGMVGGLGPYPSVRRRHVAVASAFGFHFDVYMAFVKTLGDVMDGWPTDAHGNISIFAPEFQLGYQDVVDDFGLWKHAGVRGTHEMLIDALADNGGDGAIDLVVFGTCEVE